MLARLLVALAAGAAIGFERSYHGRPAGFRTHALVCTASSLLMLVTVYEAHWMRAASALVQLDPTRMAQGIMTGIGFLGAGVIIKEGLSVRGLTTAASIWITAAMSEEKLRGLVESHGFSIANFSYRLDGEGRVRRHSMVIRSSDRASASRLAETLERTETVLEFRIAATGD